MKKLKRTLCVVLALCTIFGLAVPSFAANYSTDYQSYSEPASTHYAYWNGSRVVKASGMTTSQVKWIQAALNYCIKYKGLNASYLDVDGSFGPASRATTLAFQKKYGLSQDGSFGPKCIAKMGEIISAPAGGESKTLSFNATYIQKTGKQNVSGPCFCYSLAYARDILDGKTHAWSEYRASGYNADRRKANFSSRFEKNKSTAMKDIYEKIKAGKPVVLNVNYGRCSVSGNAGEHYVCIVGYQNVKNTANLSESNFLMIDPVTGWRGSPENLGDVGYKIKYNAGQGYYYCFE